MGQCLVECQWLILNLDSDDLLDIIRLADALECTLWIEEARTFVDGYQIVTLFIGADAEEFIKIFRQAIARFATLTHCRPSQDPTDHLTRLRTVVRRGVIQQPEGLRFLEAAQQHNRRVRDNLPVWVTGLWIVSRIDPPTLEQVIRMAQRHKIIVTYRVMRFRDLHVQFHFRIPGAQDFNRRMNAFKTYLALRQWDVVFDSDMAYEELEACPRLTRSAIPRFLELVEPHF